MDEFENYPEEDTFEDEIEGLALDDWFWLIIFYL